MHPWFQSFAAMTREKLLRLFELQRSRWLDTDHARGVMATMRKDVLGSGIPQVGKMLSDDGAWRFSLQALGMGASLPIHDHPGMRGLLTVLEGTVRVQNFDVDETCSEHGTVRLIMRGEKTICANGYDWIGRGRHNLHSLESVSDFTLVFSIRQRVSESAARRAYAFIVKPDVGQSTAVAVSKPIGIEMKSGQGC
jgi:quercetin dioxygenase-like cupin family protein